MKVTYFKVNKEFPKVCLDPQNIDLFKDNCSDLVKQYNKDIEDVVKKFLNERGYKVETVEDAIRVREQLANEDKVLDFIVDTSDIKNIKDGVRVTIRIIPFFNRISSPIDNKTKEILLENWRNINGKGG